MIVSRMIGIRVLYVKVGVYGTAVVTAITGSSDVTVTVTSSCVTVAGVTVSCGN